MMSVGRLAGAVIATAAPARDPVRSAQAEVARYAFLAGTRWIVPASTLPAIAFDLATGTGSEVFDQTVRNITDVQSGYIRGRTAAQMRDPGSGEPVAEPACKHVAGSVTPEGRVQITFVNREQSTALAATRGTGRLGRANEWRFEAMQMSSGTTGLVVHWSCTVQCRPGDACEAELPGTTSSLADFLAACDG
jgi:hypothetical protein